MLCATLLLTGCGDWCVAGFTNGGFVGVASSPPHCAKSQAMGNVRASVVTSAVCKGCNSGGDVEHVFVTVRGIQLHANTLDGGGSPEWVELDPQLANAPRSMDLIGNSLAENLVTNASVPAGYYREVRVQFLQEGTANKGLPAAGNPCATLGGNCLVRADGSVETLRLPGEAAELVIPLESAHSNSLAVLPGVQTNLQLRLAVQYAMFSHGGEGLKGENVLAGGATVEPLPTAEAGNANPD